MEKAGEEEGNYMYEKTDWRGCLVRPRRLGQRAVLHSPAPGRVVRPPTRPAGGTEARGDGGIVVSGASCGRARAVKFWAGAETTAGELAVATTLGAGWATEQFKVFDPGGGL